MYKVVVSPAAEKQIKKLTKREQIKVIKRISKLSENPMPSSVKKLKGISSVFRVRQGDWRIIYEIENKKLIVLIVKVGHRRDVYQ